MIINIATWNNWWSSRGQNRPRQSKNEKLAVCFSLSVASFSTHGVRIQIMKKRQRRPQDSASRVHNVHLPTGHDVLSIIPAAINGSRMMNLPTLRALQLLVYTTNTIFNLFYGRFVNWMSSILPLFLRLPLFFKSEPHFAACLMHRAQFFYGGSNLVCIISLRSPFRMPKNMLFRKNWWLRCTFCSFCTSEIYFHVWVMLDIHWNLSSSIEETWIWRVSKLH